MNQSTALFLLLFVILNLLMIFSHSNEAPDLEIFFSQSRLEQDVEAILSKIKENSSIIIVDGDEGSDKKTLINYLIGKPLIAMPFKDQPALSVANAENSSVQIDEARSKTQLLSFIDDQRENIFVEASQFRNSLNATMSLLNKLILNVILAKVPQMKAILVIDAQNLIGIKRNYIKKKLLEMKHMFRQFNENMVIVVSKSNCADNYVVIVEEILKEDDYFSSVDDRSYYRKVIQKAKIQQFCKASLADQENSIVNRSINEEGKEDRKKILEALNDTKSFKTSMSTVMFNEDEVSQIKKLIKWMRRWDKHALKGFSQGILSLASKLSLADLSDVISNIQSKKNQNCENLQRFQQCFEFIASPRINEKFADQVKTIMNILRDRLKKANYFQFLLKNSYDPSGNQYNAMIRIESNNDSTKYSVMLKIQMQNLLKKRKKLQNLLMVIEEGYEGVNKKQLKELRQKVEKNQSQLIKIQVQLQRLTNLSTILQTQLVRDRNSLMQKEALQTNREFQIQKQILKMKNQIDQIVKCKECSFPTEEKVANESNRFDLVKVLIQVLIGVVIGLAIGLIVGWKFKPILNVEKKQESVIKDKLQ